MKRQQSKLIFDLGLHKGEDTDYYLKRGFRVVAVEANPELVEHCQNRFSEQISTGQLTIISGAISDSKSDHIRFYKNTKNSIWGTAVKDWADRNTKLDALSIEINVPVVNIENLFERYGVPYYLKIDIEGMDLVVLTALAKSSSKPKYLSIESEKKCFEKLIQEFDILDDLGYDSFQAVQQQTVRFQRIPKKSLEGQVCDHRFPHGSSGLFGQDLPDRWLGKCQAIHRYKRIFLRYKIFGDQSIFTNVTILKFLKKIFERGTRIALPGWYDTHAKLKE